MKMKALPVPPLLRRGAAPTSPAAATPPGVLQAVARRLSEIIGRDVDPADARRLLGATAVPMPADALWVLVARVTAAWPAADRFDEIRRLAALADADDLAGRLLEDAAVGDRHRHSVRVVEGAVLDATVAPDALVERDQRRAVEALRTALPSNGVEAVWNDASDSLVDRRDGAILVPVSGPLLLAGVVDLPDRATRILCATEHSGFASAALSFGLGPLFDPASFPAAHGTDGTDRRFAWHLACLRRVDLVIGASDAVATELAGWAEMLPSIGIAPPAVGVVLLGTDLAPVDLSRHARRYVVASADDLRGDRETIRRAHDLLVEPFRVPVVEWAGAREAPLDTVDPRFVLGPGDVVLDLSPYASHSALVTAAVEAGLGVVLARSALGAAYEGDRVVTVVAPHDSLALADAMRESLRVAPISAAIREPVRGWQRFADETWAAVVATAPRP